MLHRLFKDPHYWRWVKLAFFGLLPAAYLAGIVLESRHVRMGTQGDFRLLSDRASAIAAARSFLESQGIDPAGWAVYCSAMIDKDLYRYLESKPGPEDDRARRIAPPVVIPVLFEAPSGDRHAQVLLSLDNRILGFDLHGIPPGPASGSLSDVDSMRLAQGIIQADPQLASIFGSGRPEVSTRGTHSSGVARKYTWRAPMPGLPDVEAEFSASILNSKVRSHRLKLTVSPDYIAHHRRSTDTVRDLFGIGYAVFLCAVVLYSIYGYARRAIEKEVSHTRTALMAVLATCLFLAVIATARDQIVVQSVDRSVDIMPQLGYVAVVLALVLAAAGILVGIGYGSGEGEVREAYPGKLTSLDALLLGKIFSANVGRSIVVGFAFGGWLLLARAVGMSPFSVRDFSTSLDSLRFPYMVAPWRSFLAVTPAIVLMFAVAGLLQPLAFLNRFCRNARLRTLLLVVIATTVLAGTADAYPSFAGFAVTITVSVIGLLAPFFWCDLLTAIVSLVALEYFSGLIRLNVQLHGWTTFALGMSAVTVTTVLFGGWAWWRGRAYREEEVRPSYARHIAERRELQAEVSAAREAQLRLLPQSAPEIPGLSIHASCLPARVVGGDFYDFFPLSGGRLGIFIAEGGNRGLASALTIALAKGYLMHTARGDYSPTEIIRRLESTLGSILESGAIRTTVAYAVVDARQRTLEYARTGAYPKIVVSGQTSASQFEREVPIANGQSTLWEGSAALHAGDSIVFYTDGIARRIAARSSLLQEDWILRFAQDGEKGAQVLHQSLFEAIEARPDRNSQELEDDLTAIIICCSRTGVAWIEGVA